MRIDGRKFNELRPITIEPNVNRYAEGSALVSYGDTKVLCTASIDSSVPKWMSGQNSGWISGEYGMLPRSTHTRMRRDRAAGSGRTQEITRLIGRSLRAIVDLKALGENSLIVDCDVIQADGGTRTAAVTGGFVALALAMDSLVKKGQLNKIPLSDYVSAVSVGLKAQDCLLDLNYEEDSKIHTDMNFVMTGKGSFIEIQGTAEGQPFSLTSLNEMAELAQVGCQQIISLQKEILGSILNFD